MNAKLLEKLIKQGHWVAVKHGIGEYMVFMYLRPDGEFQGVKEGLV